MGSPLAPDEAMLLGLAASGYSKDETMLSMGLTMTERGVLMGSLFRKLGARSFPHAVGLAVAAGIVQARPWPVPPCPPAPSVPLAGEGEEYLTVGEAEWDAATPEARAHGRTLEVAGRG